MHTSGSPQSPCLPKERERERIETTDCRNAHASARAWTKVVRAGTENLSSGTARRCAEPGRSNLAEAFEDWRYRTENGGKGEKHAGMRILLTAAAYRVRCTAVISEVPECVRVAPVCVSSDMSRCAKRYRRASWTPDLAAAVIRAGSLRDLL